MSKIILELRSRSMRLDNRPYSLSVDCSLVNVSLTEEILEGDIIRKTELPRELCKWLIFKLH